MNRVYKKKVKDYKIYNLNDIMKILNISRPTIIRYIKNGRIKAFKVGHAYRVTKEALDTFIKNEENKLMIKPSKLSKEEEILKRIKEKY